MGARYYVAGVRNGSDSVYIIRVLANAFQPKPYTADYNTTQCFTK